MVASCVLFGCGGPTASAPSTATTVAEPAPEAPTAASHEEAARRALEAHDDVEAERHLRTALTMPDLEDGSELEWRVRARLAELLARTSRAEEAEAVAGLMCAGLDDAMLPSFMPPLIAELEAANVCGGICGRLALCCRAFVAEMNRATGGVLDVDQVCDPLEQLVENQTVTEETCTQILEGWRQALGTLPNGSVPAACGP